MSPSLILKRYSKARPISVSGDFVPLRVTTLLDRNNPLTSSMISTRLVSSVRYSGGGGQLFFRFWNGAGYWIFRFNSSSSELIIANVFCKNCFLSAFFPLPQMIRFGKTNFIARSSSTSFAICSTGIYLPKPFRRNFSKLK